MDRVIDTISSPRHYEERFPSPPRFYYSRVEAINAPLSPFHLTQHETPQNEPIQSSGCYVRRHVVDPSETPLDIGYIPIMHRLYDVLGPKKFNEVLTRFDKNFFLPLLKKNLNGRDIVKATFQKQFLHPHWILDITVDDREVLTYGYLNRGICLEIGRLAIDRNAANTRISVPAIVEGITEHRMPGGGFQVQTGFYYPAPKDTLFQSRYLKQGQVETYNRDNVLESRIVGTFDWFVTENGAGIIALVRGTIEFYEEGLLKESEQGIRKWNAENNSTLLFNGTINEAGNDIKEVRSGVAVKSVALETGV